MNSSKLFVSALVAVALISMVIECWWSLDGHTVELGQGTEIINASTTEFQNGSEKAFSLGILQRIVAFVTWSKIPDRPVFQPEVPFSSTSEPMGIDLWRFWCPTMWLQKTNSFAKLQKTFMEYKVSQRAAEKFFLQCEDWNDFVRSLPIGASSSGVLLESSDFYKSLLTSYNGYCDGACSSLTKIPESLRIDPKSSLNVDADFLKKFCIRCLVLLVIIPLGNLLVQWMMPRDRTSQKAASILIEKGDTLHSNGHYEDAAGQYTKALELDYHNPVALVKRCKANFELGNLKEALTDALTSIVLNEAFTDGYVELARIQLMTGDRKTATSYITKIPAKDQELDSVKEMKQKIETLKNVENKINEYEKVKDYHGALCVVLSAVDAMPLSLRYRKSSVKFYALIGKMETAKSIAAYIKGSSEYDEDDVSLNVDVAQLVVYENPKMAENLLKIVLREEPRHVEALRLMKSVSQQKIKQEGNDAFKKGDTDKALGLYKEALAIDTGDCESDKTIAQLHGNCAVIYSKNNQHEEAVEACSAALKVDPSYLKAFQIRAKHYRSLNKEMEATVDMKVFQILKNQ